MIAVQKTKMVKKYRVWFVFRLIIFFIAFAAYLFDKQHIWRVMTDPVYFGVSPVRFLWLLFMIIMIQHLFPNEARSMALRKRKEKYVVLQKYNELDLLRFVQQQNVRAWTVMLVWLLLNAVFGILFLMKIFDEADLFMLTVFFSCATTYVFCFSVRFRHLL